VTRAAGVLSGGRVLTKWVQQNASQGTLIQKIVTAVNTLADNTASSAVGRLAPPPPINALNVKVSGEYAHMTIDHSATIQQGVHYFVEMADNPAFSGAWPIHFGASRTRDPIHLPALDDAGNPQTYYARAFAQYPGSSPTEATNYGGPSPTPITPSGSTRLSLLPSTGSGTSTNTGSQPGWGFGKIQRRQGS